MTTKQSAKATAPAQPTALTIDVTPSREAREALTLRGQAQSLVVIDSTSHAHALEFIRGAKQLKRKIEDHWSRITRTVDDMKKNLLNLKRDDLAPVEEAIEMATSIALTYEQAEKRRADLETERLRVEAQAQAEEDRANEQARLEAEATRAEAASEDLSEREQTFVALYLSVNCALERAPYCAKQAGYADWSRQAKRLLATPKILKAIEGQRKATTIRQQAQAKAEAPLEVVSQTVKADLGKAAGVSTRNSYSAKVANEALFFEAVLAGRIPVEYIRPNQVALNAIAEKAPSLFAQAFPGCELVTKTTIAG